jgi:hypothetical protein
MAVREVQIVDDGFILKMLNHPSWVAAFPFLAPYVALLKGKASCGRCGKKTVQRVGLGDLKKTIASLSAAQQDKFKAMAGVRRVEIYHRNSGNQVVKTSF